MVGNVVAAKTSDLYARYGNGTQGLDMTWGYDDRSQVTSEVTKLGGSGTVLTGRDDAFAYENPYPCVLSNSLIQLPISSVSYQFSFLSVGQRLAYSSPERKE